jgi:hypothetical protein
MPPRPVRLRGFARVKAIGRVIFYLGCVNLVLTGLWVSHARAQVEQSLQRGGLELLQQLGPELTGDAQEVRLNGQSMFLSSRVLKQRGVAEVLTAVERHCQKPEAGPPRIGDTAVPDDANWDFGRLLISRLEDPEKRSGQVACLASPDRDRSFDGFTKRLARFAQKFDLAELGQMRYAVARHDAVGNRTHLLLVWSEGSLSVPALFPAEGDAPGSDSAVAPRPPAAVRVLSAEVPDHPYALRLYDTDRSFQEVLDAYDRSMKERGWSQKPLAERPEVPTLAANLRAYMKDGAGLLVLVSGTPNGKTGVSLVEMGTPGHVRITTGASE